MARAGTPYYRVHVDKWLEAGRCFVLTPPFQCAVQFSIATVVVGLFVFVKPLTFPLSCLGAVLLTVLMAVLSPDNHIGSRLMACATQLGAMTWGSVIGGGVLSLSHLARPSSCSSLVGCGPYTAALCCLGVAVLGLLVGNRAALGAPYQPLVWLAGLLSIVGYGIVLIAGYLIDDLRVMWEQVVGSLLLVNLLAAGTCAAVSLLVLPSLALDELRADTAVAIRAIGHAAGSIASRTLKPETLRPLSGRWVPGMTVPAATDDDATWCPLPLELGVHPRRQQHPPDHNGDLQPISEVQLGGQQRLQQPRQQQQQQQLESPPLGDTAGGSAADASARGAPLQLLLQPPRLATCASGSRTPRFAADVEMTPPSDSSSDPSHSSNPYQPGHPPTCHHLHQRAGSRVRPAPADTKTAVAAPSQQYQQPGPLPLPARSRLPGVDSCPSLERLDCAGAPNTSGYASSSHSSEDEQQLWGVPRAARRDVGFEHVMEDEDAFLRLLQEATAPQATADPRVGATGRRPPSPVAPPGGIRPSPSTLDLLRAATEASGMPSRAQKKKKKKPAAKGAAAEGAAAAEGEAVGAGMPGAGPATAHGGGGLSGGAVAWAPVSAIRPLLARAKACAASAAVEPPWMMSGNPDLASWSRLLCCCEALVNRVAALECLLEDHRPGQGHMLGDASLVALLGLNVAEPYRQVYGEVAASCAAMSSAVAASCGGRQLRTAAQGFAAVGGWGASKQRLRAVVREALSRYWARVRGGGPAGGGSSTEGAQAAGAGAGAEAAAEPSSAQQRQQQRRSQLRQQRSGRIPIMGLHQSRALNYLWTVTEGVINAMDDLEGAVRQALGEQQQPPAPTAAASRVSSGADCAGPPRGAHHASDAGRKGGRPGSGGSSGGRDGTSNASSGIFTTVVAPMAAEAPGGSETSRGAGCPPAHLVVVLTDPEGAQQPAAAAAAAAPPLLELARTRLHAYWCRTCTEWDWALRLLKLVAGLPLLQNTPTITAATVRLLLASGSGPRRLLLSSRTFQFGCKYWLATSFMLLLILGLTSLPEAALLRKHSLLYAFIATSICMTERVESTLSRAALRAAGTLLGGALGLGVMLSPGLSGSPVGVMAIVCAVSFLTGCMTSNPLLYGVVLTLVTLQSMVLCQYGGWCCGAISTAEITELFMARVVSVLVGCTLPVVFTQAMLPWYTSDWAMETMASACMSSAALVRHLYTWYYEEHRSAHIASCGLRATTRLLRLHGLEEEAEGLEAEGLAAEGEELEGGSRGQQGGGSEQHGGGQGAGGQRLVQRGDDEAVANPVRSTEGGVYGLPARREQQRRQPSCLEKEEAGKKMVEQAEADAAAGKGVLAQAVAVAAAAAAAAAGGSSRAAAEPKAATAVTLQQHVSGPLVAVQISLMKDTAVWTRGIYATPMIVPAVLRCCLLLSDRLAALQLVVADTPPPVYGRLSGWAFAQLVLPLHREMTVILGALDLLAAGTARLLDPDGSYCTPTEEEAEGAEGEAAAADAAAGGSGPERRLLDIIHELDQRRLLIRQSIHDMRRAFHASIRSLDEQHLAHATHPDDTVRFHAMLFALVKVLDKATATARTALQRRRRGGAPRAPGAWFAWGGRG